MIKSKEQISDEKKKYYIKRKEVYALRGKNGFIPFATFAMNDSELLPEHAFGFSGVDINEERMNYYMEVIK